MKAIILAVTIITSSVAMAVDSDKFTVKKNVIDNVEVVWLEDNRSPLYNVEIYFADGALSDPSSKIGTTEMMLELLSSGTNRYGHKEIADALEYFGVSTSYDVTHEFSRFSISGLTKDAIPTFKMICHLFHDAIFPVDQIRKSKRLRMNRLQSLVNDKGVLADRAFRYVTMKDSPFSQPPGGTKASIRKIYRRDLINKLKYFNTKVKKRVYMSGPTKLWKIKDIFVKECGWGKEAVYQRRVETKKTVAKKSSKRPNIYLVPVKNSSQAQIRLGRYLPYDVLDTRLEIYDVMEGLLGSGFTSLLMRELRVKRGLTYGANAFMSRQLFYGRSGITTFT
ncbi:MAG: M16 family metallopeptidase, partial [Bacteriovoracia bacterium]